MNALNIIEVIAFSIVLAAVAVSMFWGSVNNNSHVRYRDDK
jgi:nitrogen fixation-related uncharacterized protein